MSEWRPAWYFDGLAALRVLAESGKPFTSDDLHASIGQPPHYNMTGKLFREAQSLRLIKRTGRSVKSTRPSRKRARIQEWVGAQVPVPSSSTASVTAPATADGVQFQMNVEVKAL